MSTLNWMEELAFRDGQPISREVAQKRATAHFLAAKRIRERTEQWGTNEGATRLLGQHMEMVRKYNDILTEPSAEP